MRAAKARYPEVQFLMAGDGLEQDWLEHLAIAPGVAGSVTWLGHCRDVANLMAAADVVVLPSVREGTQHVLLEALALGRPIVATRMGGTSRKLWRMARQAFWFAYEIPMPLPKRLSLCSRMRRKGTEWGCWAKSGCFLDLPLSVPLPNWKLSIRACYKLKG